MTAVSLGRPDVSAGRRPVAANPAWIALIRSAGLWAVPALVVVEVVNAAARDRIWAIEWQWTAYWSNASTFLVAPLVAAIAAAESILYRRRRADTLLGSGRDRLRAHLLRGGATGCWGAVAHLVGVLACAASAAGLHHDFRLPIGPTLPAFAAVLACGLIGAAVGWLWPSLAAPPLVAIVGVALTSLAPISGLQQYARVDTATASLLGLVTRPASTAADVVWWSALAIAALWLMSRPTGGGPVGRWDAAVVVLLIAAGAGVATQSGHRFASSGRPVPQTCSATAPTLCVSSEYASRLAAYAGPSVALSSALGRLDPAARPTRLVQAGSIVAGSPMVSGTVAVSVDPRGRADSVDLAFDLVEAVSGCPQASTGPSDALVRDEERLVAWLAADAHLTAPGLPPLEDPIGSAAQAATVLAALRGVLTLAWPPLVFVRSRGGGRAVAVLAATALAGALVQPEPVPVKFRLASVGLGPLVAALPGVFLPTMLERPERQLEPSRCARLVALRLLWLGTLLVASTVVGQVAVGGPGAWRVAARSVALAGGLGLLAAQLVPALVAWLPGLVLVVVTFVYGTASMSGRPYAWAVVLQPERSPRAGLLAGALVLAGGVAYVWRDSRST